MKKLGTDHVKWIEVIEFRSFNTDDALLELDLWNQLVEATKEADVEAINVYHHSTLSTDISIHVHHESAQAVSQGSSFGERLVSELKVFGVINHTVWVKKKELQ